MTNGSGLWVEHLTRRFGRLTAVDDLTFRADRGAILGLLGPNGAGKTTTLLCLAGLLRPDSGVMTLDGSPLGAERGRVVALIPETPEVYAMLTVWEHLVFIAKSCRLDSGWQQRAQELLLRLDLFDKRDTLGEALSKGMRQKTLIASTVLAGAPVLLLDEPMIGLDPKGQRELRSILLELRNAGTAVVLSTHLLESAEALCDQVLVMNHGHAVISSPIAELRFGELGRSLEDVFLEATK
ncbi:MAG TPA: ABC transporter ATP-binding protein [Candidatus Eremiobacteraceae bacterium]|jgi:ABC-2 type transport system ATP-binding protein|nr:ABC transporter ATP-binding protein [Candidatus Eremiobacteraceae bacterium]